MPKLHIPVLVLVRKSPFTHKLKQLHVERDHTGIHTSCFMETVDGKGEHLCGQAIAIFHLPYLSVSPKGGVE